MIKLSKMLREEKNIKYKLFVDLDGVLTDFDGDFLKISDEPVKDGWQYQQKYGKERFWNLINSKGISFWSNMQWSIPGKKLWNFLQNTGLEVKILSAPSTHDYGNSVKGKLIWCKRNLKPNTKVILEKKKYLYSSPNSILIDDLEKNIMPWREHGGIGILYKSLDDTIHRLKDLGING